MHKLQLMLSYPTTPKMQNQSLKSKEEKKRLNDTKKYTIYINRGHQEIQSYKVNKVGCSSRAQKYHLSILTFLLYKGK